MKLFYINTICIYIYATLMFLLLGTIKKITSPSAKPISHHAASADCPNRPAMRPICFLA
jgi:hypothetical protein